MVPSEEDQRVSASKRPELLSLLYASKGSERANSA
jgi:hypothetical protein